jgi:polyisoprenoid-binding protein YceI
MRVVGIVVAVALVAVAGAGAAFWFGKSDSPAPVRLSGDSGSGSGSASTLASSAAGTSTGLAGTWKVQPSGRSFVGYRVTEKLASLPRRSDAVGRTAAVTGTMTISGSTVTAASVTADLTQLRSDQQRRDNAIRLRGLETQAFPQATFKLTAPIRFGAVAPGKVLSATATGDLTLHGITRTVQIPLQGKYTGSTIEVVGTLPIQFADFQIQPPDFAGFVTVDDHGTIEFDLVFTKSA